jgi:hypothetical protein
VLALESAWELGQRFVGLEQSVQLVVLLDEELQQASERLVFDGEKELLLTPSLQVPV